MDYGNSLGISCFLKVYSRATCSLQLYKYDSVTSMSSQMIFFPCAGRTAVYVETMGASYVEVCTVEQGS